MDFHKLQQTLNDIEPSDRAQDIERLRQAAQGNNSPSPRAPVTESRDVKTVPSTHRELNETEQFAALAGITPSTSKKEPINNVANEMAALAGINITESKKKVNQLKGKDTVGKSKSSKNGEQKNVTRGKLVGSTDLDNEDSIEEGTWDTIKKAGTQGWKNYNSRDAFKGVTKHGQSGGSSKSSKTSKSSKSEGTLPPKLSSALAPYATALTNVMKDPEKKELFTRLMATADPSLKKSSTRESKQVSDRASTIKEDLMRRLNSSK